MRQKFYIFHFVVLALMSLQNAGAAIELQPHQKVPVQDLLAHPDKKGLLLFHSLGSGKTYITLDYAEKNPGKKVIIFLPEFLKANWLSQMKSFGVKDISRYELISFSKPDALLKQDLSNTVVIVDEIHKLIFNMRLGTFERSQKYIESYQKLQTAKKLVVLTGTPVFVDIADIAYIANLFDEKQPYPLDPVKFRTEYMKVKPMTQLVRGSITESKLFSLAVPFFATLTAVVTLGSTAPLAIPVVAFVGSSILPVANEVFPANQVIFREFDAQRWKDFAREYVSYYQVKLAENENYPKKTIIEKKVYYNEFQTQFFLNFVDEDLSLDQLKTLLAEEKQTWSDSYLRVHSSRLQKQLLLNPLSGREIGNLEHKKSDQTLVESEKFLEILKVIQGQPGQVAIYSSYDANGIQKFAAFLDRHAMKDQYLALSPDQSVETQIRIVEEYNQAKKRILLIHPEITEGISLNGTEQFHILEPMSNQALSDQVIGRAIRYRSHAHLPENRRRVNVYQWESVIDYTVFKIPSTSLEIPTQAGLLRRENWQRKFSEMNPSMWTKGILELDSAYFLKDETPDSRVKRIRSNVARDLGSFQDLLEDYHIEK